MQTHRVLQFLSLGALLALNGCPSDGDDDDSTVVGDDDDQADDDDSGGDDDDSAGGLADTTFEEFGLWSEPLLDYVEAMIPEYGEGGFHTSVWDLTLYLDRMYFGYGDADINSGRVFPTELRYFTDPDDPDTWEVDFSVDEEMVEQYRQFDGDDGLYIAGLDATEDDLWGNAYNRHPDTEWFKSRTLEHALHVHDIALFDGDLYAVGSGCTWDEYDAFQISSMFWHSSDGGESFEVVEKLINPGQGDARWVRLLPVGDELYLFGYRTDTEYITDFLSYRYDGLELDSYSGMARMWVSDTHVIDATRGLAFALWVPAAGDYTYEAYILEEGGLVTEIEGMGDVTPLDAFPVGDGRWLLLVRDGNLYGDPAGEDHWIYLADATFTDFTPLATYSGDPAPVSLAYWREVLYLGTDDGTVWRARPQ